MSFHFLDKITYIGFSQGKIEVSPNGNPVLNVPVDSLTTLRTLQDSMLRQYNLNNDGIVYVNFEEELEALFARIAGPMLHSHHEHLRMFPILPEQKDYETPFYAKFEMFQSEEAPAHPLPQDHVEALPQA